ncbi:MAG TPA: metalloregulator ArsR/SmtB family transcription factor [Acidimicrobiia bacterium]
MDGRQAKDALYEQFARIGKAVASPKRIELLDLLCQGERTVEALAGAARMGLTNTSAHLQVLRQARLLETRREGVKVFYRLADEAVCRFFIELRDLARARLAKVEQVVGEYFEARDRLEPVRREELLARIEQGQAVVIDLRPSDEYRAGHIAGAISIPLGELVKRLGDLPREAEIVAYCRGPLCVLAPQALEFLRDDGLRARRLEDGFPEWRQAGLPVEVGEGR